MQEASYHGGSEFARGAQKAQTGQAWVGAAGHWVVMDRDEIGEHARPATAGEVAGIRHFYGEYAPWLRIAGGNGGEA